MRLPAREDLHRGFLGGQTHPLPRPFFVMATQNPVEQEGTYPLPEAQTDRFLFKLLVDYPTAEEESLMMQRWGLVTKQPALAAVSGGEELLALRAEVDRMHVAPALQAYILALVRGTRELADTGSPNTTPYIIGGTTMLALGAAFVAYSIRREHEDLGPVGGA